MCILRAGSYRRAGRLLSAALLLILAALCLTAAGVWRARELLYAALYARGAPAVQQTYLPEFALRTQMHGQQATTQVSGWLTVIDRQEVLLNVGGETRFAAEYAPITGDAYAPWALVLHGGTGTDGTQMLDVACELSLAGYRVLLPDMRSHGRSEGQLTSLGLREKEDVLSWVQWISVRSGGNRIVIAAQDEGAAAALLAARELEGRVCAIAADSAYADVYDRAEKLLQDAMPDAGAIDRWLFRSAFSLLYGADGKETTEAVRDIATPLLIIHGTADEDVPAWHGEDIAKAAGGNAQLLLAEGGLHGMSRFADPKAYYGALTAFFDRCIAACGEHAGH